MSTKLNQKEIEAEIKNDRIKREQKEKIKSLREGKIVKK